MATDRCSQHPPPPPHLSTTGGLEKSRALEEIVDSLESGNVALEASIQIYQRGNLLRLHCEAKLKDAQSKIEKITGTGDGEDPDTEPLDIG